jgi:8-oxo-dGTP pyrophosphatase MutT (NUDIX family)
MRDQQTDSFDMLKNYHRKRTIITIPDKDKLEQFLNYYRELCKKYDPRIVLEYIKKLDNFDMTFLNILYNVVSPKNYHSPTPMEKTYSSVAASAPKKMELEYHDDDDENTANSNRAAHEDDIDDNASINSHKSDFVVGTYIRKFRSNTSYEFYDKKLPISCGAILFTCDSRTNQLGCILGLEFNSWTPFKGVIEAGETLEQTAAREIKEETGGLIEITEIDLIHKFTTLYKHYCIGAIAVKDTFVAEFHTMKIKNIIDKKPHDHLMKDSVAFFTFHDAFRSPEVHSITKKSLHFYLNKTYILNWLRRIFPNTTG